MTTTRAVVICLIGRKPDEMVGGVASACSAIVMRRELDVSGW